MYRRGRQLFQMYTGVGRAFCELLKREWKVHSNCSSISTHVFDQSKSGINILSTAPNFDVTSDRTRIDGKGIQDYHVISH